MSQVTRPEYQPIEGSYNEKTKEFKVEDKKIQNVAKGNWGKFLHWIGYSSKLMISSEGQVRDIYVPKYIAQKFIQDERISKLKGFELLRSKIGDVFAKALGSPPIESAASVAPQVDIGLNTADLIKLINEAVPVRGERSLTRDILIGQKQYAFLFVRSLKTKSCAITIQSLDKYYKKAPEEKIELNINLEGKVLSVSIDSMPAQNIPEDRKEILKASFNEILNRYHIRGTN